MSSVSNPYDNAKAESFFKTLKQEEVYLKEYESFADAEANLAVFKLTFPVSGKMGSLQPCHLRCRARDGFPGRSLHLPQPACSL